MFALVKRRKSFGGWTCYFQHASRTTGTTMRFAAYLPPAADEPGAKLPVVYFLSGLTCTEENFITKSGVQAHAAQHGLVIVAPDTSPRGAAVPGEDDSWDLGTGASFYVNATQKPWSSHYRMYDYVRDELPALVGEHLPVDTGRQGIMGHSMGGHGALVLALREPSRYLSVSAFAPICAPSQCPWGIKALSAYLGSDRTAWRDYDAVALVAQSSSRLPLFVDQGSGDEFLAEQLKPELLREACRAAQYPLELRMREGYDHSYDFIATFLGEHIAHHARALR